MDSLIVIADTPGTGAATDLKNFFERWVGGRTKVVCVAAGPNLLETCKAVLSDVPSQAEFDFEALWLMSDTLAGDWISFAALFDETRDAEPDLAFHQTEALGDSPALDRSPLLRFSRAMIVELLNARDWDSRMQFLDRELAAVADGSSRRKWLNLSLHKGMSRLLTPLAPSRLGRDPAFGISWPVTEASERKRILAFQADLGARTGQLAAKYRGSAEREWFYDDVERWTYWFGTHNPAKIMEFGGSNGVGANLLLDHIFPHPDSEIHYILTGSEQGDPDSYDFAVNTRTGGHLSQIQLYDGSSVEILAWMIAEESYWESFDFIHFRCPANGPECMTASCQAWSLLKPGGIVVFDHVSLRVDAIHPAEPVIESFQKVFGNYFSTLLQGERTILRKNDMTTPATTQVEEISVR